MSVMNLACSFLYLSMSASDFTLNFWSSSFVMFCHMRPTSFIMSSDGMFGFSLTTLGLVYYEKMLNFHYQNLTYDIGMIYNISYLSNKKHVRSQRFFGLFQILITLCQSFELLQVPFFIYIHAQLSLKIFYNFWLTLFCSIFKHKLIFLWQSLPKFGYVLDHICHFYPWVLSHNDVSFLKDLRDNHIHTVFPKIT